VGTMLLLNLNGTRLEITMGVEPRSLATKLPPR
jgi:hypothetical protein